jgi:hypothetical protein
MQFHVVPRLQKPILIVASIAITPEVTSTAKLVVVLIGN